MRTLIMGTIGAASVPGMMRPPEPAMMKCRNFIDPGAQVSSC